MKLAMTITIEVLFVIVGSIYLLGVVMIETYNKQLHELKLFAH